MKVEYADNTLHSGQTKQNRFSEIWNKYYPKLMVFVIPFFKDKTVDAEDAVQEILLRVFQSFSNYDSKYSVSTWIYTIARNYCIDQSRKEIRLNKWEQDVPDNFQDADEYFNPESLFLKAELKEKIRNLILTLDETDQQICFLYNYEDLNYREISGILKIPVGTIKYRMYKIRDKLKKKLETYYEKIN
ncbi:MAG: RNA polymerase sigma factor [Spirochaetales bacterium]|nr:RNA polymerase sigma factor [Spirochaetales bacterium]